MAFHLLRAVFAMVVVGGVTRLTHSGLSITEWAPIVGTLPPLSDGDWADAFARYRATPEFRQVNPEWAWGLQAHFWWEYLHRLLGRAIGAAFLLPYLWFLVRRRVPRGYAGALGAIFVLGGVAGRARLVHGAKRARRRSARVAPSPDGTPRPGLSIFGAMLWVALSLSRPRPAGRGNAALRRFAGRWWDWSS